MTQQYFNCKNHDDSFDDDGDFGDYVFELSLLPGICWMIHHGDDGIVILLILVVQEDQLGPQVSLFCCSQDFWDVNS